MNQRSFLLLQGVASPFFSELEKALHDAGAQALKVNFCGGDLFSGKFLSTSKNKINFRKEINHLSNFYHELYEQYAITDIILFGDTRPVHLPAIEIAKDKNIHIHVFEEGYLRPDWVTLESDGVNACSNLPKDPNWYLQNSVKRTKECKPTSYNFLIRVWHDVRYHIIKTVCTPYFPHYQSHRPDPILKEYWGFIKRLPLVFIYHKWHANKKIEQLLATTKPFYVLPLQLNSDSQIRLHSTIDSVADFIQTAIKSFAEHTNKETMLVIKNHPLDTWITNYKKVINQASKENNLDPKRILYLEAGNLEKLLKNAQGTVLVNSTVGKSALALNCPVIALGNAIYDMPGLTFQGTLDEFWTDKEKPNQPLFDAFQTFIIENTQINGNFYTKKGIEMTVKKSLEMFHKKDKHACFYKKAIDTNVEL